MTTPTWQQKDSDVGVWQHWCPTRKENFKTWLSACPHCGKPAPDFPQLFKEKM